MKGKVVVNSIIFLFITWFASAQAHNNNIEDRIQLFLDSGAYSSATDNSSVQWKCVNKKLTEKCLVYHNDQWFYFIPPVNGRYFLNVTRQQCRDKRGVQVLLIEGNPCVTSTYRLKHCTSFTNQDDTFIVLDSLLSGVEYLINIDGFLGDFCSFDIQFATQPRGFPADRTFADTLDLKGSTQRGAVVLQWSVSQAMAATLDHMEIHRKQLSESRMTHVADSRMVSNALGAYQEQYTHEDTIQREGHYEYWILGAGHDGMRTLLDRVRVEFTHPPAEAINPGIRYIIRWPFEMMEGIVDVVVSDGVTNEPLASSVIAYGRHATVEFDVTNLVRSGHRFFKMKATHRVSQNSTSDTFTFSDTGELIRIKKVR